MKSKGFTLIELIVVMAVFLFVIGAAIGIFISIIQSQKRVLSEQQFLNQISYVEEHMSKALRMAGKDTTGGCLGQAGYIYLLTRYNTSTALFRGIKFLNQSEVDSSGNPVCQEFFLAGAGTPADPYVLKELKNSNNNDNAVPLTSSNLQISNYLIRFGINGSTGGTLYSDSCQSTVQCGASDVDLFQPRVTILLNIKIPGEKLTRTIQTSVSQRNFNVTAVQRLKVIGESCTSGSDCQSGYCDTYNHVCSNGDRGDGCGSGYDCYSLYCDTYNHICTYGSLGEGCGSRPDCYSLYYCDTYNHICTYGSWPDGCGANTDCQSGYCDTYNHVCWYWFFW